MRITFRKQLLWLISVAALAVASASFASVFGPQSEKKSPASSFDETMLPGPDIITGASLVALPNRPVRIARIVLPELPSTLQATQVTADLLKKAFWPHSVEFETLTSGALTERIREGSVDAFVASSGYYWRMTQYGATAVGTLISDRQPDPNNATALAFLVRAKDERFNELYDLKGYSVGSTFATAFMTYRIGLAEIAKLGEDPENFFAQTVFTQRTDNSEVVSLLDRGLVDAVMVKACWLEAQPTEVQSRYRVLAPRFGGVGCKHSTDTYPGIMMAVTQGAHPIIAHVIARTILSHPLLPDGHRWAVTTDMRAVDNVYRLLKIENYAYLREMTLHRWLITHWQVPAFVALLLLGLLLHSWRTSVLVRKRTAQLSSALTERENAQAEIQSLSERMESLHKVTVVGQLSSMVAHELAQPLSVIQYYCESQRDILKNKPINERLLDISRVGIEKALARTRSIVDKVRSYNRGNTSRDDSVDVEASVKRVCATLNAELLRKTSFNVLCKPALSVRADKLELELILSNLLKNALEASNEASHPVVIIEAFPCADQVVVRVENSGKVLSEEDFHRLKTPLLSSKATGLGLGVTIASALAEANGGQIQFKARPEGGLIAVVTLLSAASLPENASRTPTDISRKEF